MAEDEGVLFNRESAALIARMVRRELGSLNNPPGTPQDVPRASSDQWVPFINDSSETAPANAIMRIATGSTALTVDTDAATRVIHCTKPDTTFGRYAVNSPFDVPAGGGGLCALSGMVDVAYDSGTPASDEGWGAKPSQWTATKGFPGTCIVSGITDATNKVMHAELRSITTLIGKLDGTLSQGSTATVSIWAGAGNAESDTTMNVGAYDWLMKSGATAIASGKKVKLDLIDGTWYVTEAECA